MYKNTGLISLWTVSNRKCTSGLLRHIYDFKTQIQLKTSLLSPDLPLLTAKLLNEAQ